ncbi:MAG: hypothetical protein JW991_02235 [Candidatus Pacebacteria bacterium]|nr:hypothetical protein [Candidatus Paceibacterota bacterium]
MGKKRIRLVGEEAQPKKQAKEQQVVKTGKEHGRIVDMGQAALEEAQRIADKEKKLEEEAQELISQETSKRISPKNKKVKVSGKKYLAACKKVDRRKKYPLKEAVLLIKQACFTRFDSSIELHLCVEKTGLSGTVSFPHPTGKETKIKIADDKLLKEIKKGNIDFDILIAPPAMMAKLAPLAKILGPKGLMPNPKKGTISDNPRELKKNLLGKTQYQTEKKNPLIHLVVAKTSQTEKEILENIQAALESIGQSKIAKAILTSTMGPGIKLNLEV